ncbi:MAG: response regulator [Treponema sp.]|nr:response regulator [Treponema sp.]
MGKFVPASTISTGRKKIIYVDDMNYNLIAFKKALGQFYEIYTIESADKMYKLLENINADLIVLDVNMPDVDGYKTIKNLKSDERYSSIPVIFLTSNVDREDVVKGLSLGASDYLVKPFDAKKISASIENIFDPKKAAKNSFAEKKNGAPSVLVVDDSTSMLRTIHHALHDQYNVFLISKSEVVIDFLQTNKPDLILMDYLMPGLSGFQLVPKIRALPEYAKIPIIIVTTEGTLKNVSEAIALGASDFIKKPFEPKELNQKIERHIRITNELKQQSENDFLLN